MEAPCFSISAQESFVMYAKSKKHNKNQLLISRKYRTLLRMLPSSTERPFRRCTEAFPTPSTGGKTHDSPPRHHHVGFFMD